jgi:protein SCO1/2
VPRTLLPLLALLLLPAAALAQPGSRGLVPAAPLRGANPEVGIDEKIGEPIPLDLQFRDETGRPILLRDCFLSGKPAILVLGYYRCPMLCSQVLNGLLDAMKPMPLTAGKDFAVVNVSFDPKEHHEIASDKKKAFVAEYGRPEAEAGCRFLTGDRRAIDELTAAVGFRFQFDKVYKEYDHPSGLIILTPDGKVARYFYGISYSGEYKVATEGEVPQTTTLRLSLVEASDGKVGSILDRLILSCYRFDHLERRYSFNILLAVRVGGVLMIVALAGVIYLVVRGSRRASAKAAVAVGETADRPAEGV